MDRDRLVDVTQKSYFSVAMVMRCKKVKRGILGNLGKATVM